MTTMINVYVNSNCISDWIINAKNDNNLWLYI